MRYIRSYKTSVAFKYLTCNHLFTNCTHATYSVRTAVIEFRAPRSVCPLTNPLQVVRQRPALKSGHRRPTERQVHSKPPIPSRLQGMVSISQVTAPWIEVNTINRDSTASQAVPNRPYDLSELAQQVIPIDLRQNTCKDRGRTGPEL